MNTISVSSRARTLGTFAAAGVTALIATLAGNSSAGAAAPALAEGPRITLTGSVVCSGGAPVAIDFAYDDHVDGHVPQVVRERIYDGSGEVFARDELHQVNGDYFNSVRFPDAGQALKPAALYTYDVMISYDDGATEWQSAEVNLAGACPATPPTTAAPSTPEPDRFALSGDAYSCGTAGGGAYVEWLYADYADGHYAARFDIDLLKNGAVLEHHSASNPDPTSDGASTTFSFPSDFFNVQTIEVASYSLSITVTSEDGETDKHVATFNLDDLCNGVVNGRTAAPPPTTAPATTVPAGTPTTTTVPTGTLPETGANDATWVIGVIAGLMTTAGGALFAGARRSRTN